MTKSYISSMSKMEESPNQLVAALFTEEAVDNAMQTDSKFKAPEYLFHHNAAEPLFDEDGQLTFYNRRLRDGAPVYVLAQ